MRRRLVVALMVVVMSEVFSDDDGDRDRLHGDALFDTSSVISEDVRVARFKELHGSWPDRRWLQRELPSYSRSMSEREAEISKLEESQDRWDAWMFVAQARMLENMTKSHWEVVRAPNEAWRKLYAKYHESLSASSVEKEDGRHSGVNGPIPPDFLEQEALNYEILRDLKSLHEAWAGVELEPTSVYGVRVYRNGSTLADHLDVPETHVISSILHVDSDLDAPFPLEIQEPSGTYAAVDLKPGQMCFYESAKAFHKRSQPMQGRHYGSVFLHYRPKAWTFSREQIRYAVPPFWNHAVAAAEKDSKDDEVSVLFKLDSGAIAPRGSDDDQTFVVSWVPPADDADPEDFATLSSASPSFRAKTFAGHVWQASLKNRDGSRSTQRRWTVYGDETFIVQSAGEREEL